MAKSLKDLQDKNKFHETDNLFFRGQLAAVQNGINQQRDALNIYMNSTPGESALKFAVLV